MSQRFVTALLAGSLLTGVVSVVAAPPAAAQALHTSQDYVEDVTRPSSFDIQDPMAVFAFVFGALPDRVQVYPTENYHYFRFVHNGVPYTGNMRLAAPDRDRGLLHFTYGNEPSDWSTTIQIERRILGKSQGIAIEKIEDLLYKVTFRDRSITFALNDVSKVRPPEGRLRADEIYIGPVFDEAAIRFFLVFNSKLKVFHYILDETQPVADAFVPLRGYDRIAIGRRTGFAFYQDGDRRVLIGANARASMLNTPYDGPFDQIPENFIQGETLRDAILAVEPELKGRVDRLGNLDDTGDRFLIHPYLLYDRPAALAVFERCLDAVAKEQRPLCFVITDEEAQKPQPQPLGMTAAAVNDKPAAGVGGGAPVDVIPPIEIPPVEILPEDRPPAAAPDQPAADQPVPAAPAASGEPRPPTDQGRAAAAASPGAVPSDPEPANSAPTDVVPPSIPAASADGGPPKDEK